MISRPSNKLRPVTWQEQYIVRFLTSHARVSLLVAPTGSSKTIVAQRIADSLIEAKKIDGIAILATHSMVGSMWSHILNDGRIDLAVVSVQDYADDPHEQLHPRKRWLIIADGLAKPEAVVAAVQKTLKGNGKSRALFTAERALPGLAFDDQYSISLESIIGKGNLSSASTQTDLIKLAPTIKLIRTAQLQSINIDNMSWRQYEKFIAELLEGDDYEIELMRGTKDGGVDIVAFKDDGVSGQFKTLWQAKRKRADKKVGLAVVRELADTRIEFKASKAFVVTSSYLTRGALQRIERDKYILGKMDRDDVDKWIRRTLYGRKSG